MTRDFNDDWLFQKEGQAEERVHLPHDAMITEPWDASCRNGVNTGFSGRKICLYQILES